MFNNNIVFLEPDGKLLRRLANKTQCKITVARSNNSYVVKKYSARFARDSGRRDACT